MELSDFYNHKRFMQGVYEGEELMELSAFYNHKRFMQGVYEGEELISAQAKNLAKMKPETSDIRDGDPVVSTGLGTYQEGLKGVVVDHYYNGAFLMFVVDWSQNRKKMRLTNERLKDIRRVYEL